ncbi:MAG: 3-deoxy-D-manno-octulosonic acid transferase [Armatimonadetes bacterium]|nr:3-deoxy-D-manno-octulosonic acid transferase [Armatimonadota bacterium]
MATSIPHRLAYFLYNAVLIFCAPLLLVYLVGRLAKGKSREGLRERLGRMDPLEKAEKRVWIHAVSVGEVNAARPVVAAIKKLSPHTRIVFSTITPTGQALARKAVPEAERFLYFPFDLPWAVRRSLDAVRPDLFIFFETELWPNFLHHTYSRGIPALMVNGRLSDKGYRRSLRAAPLFRWMLAYVTRCLMQSDVDAERIRSLGAAPEKVRVYGNTKFDQEFASLTAGEKETYRSLFGWDPGHPVLIAGSTHPGEEEAVLDAYRHLLGKLPSLRLLVAPRHIERTEEIEAIVQGKGFTAARRTLVSSEKPATEGSVILLDTIGELARVYGLSTVAFVGGSLAPIGGHDILQPLAFGVPPVFGPYMQNFRDISALALQAGVGFQVDSAAELSDTLLGLLQDERLRASVAKRVAQLIEANRGAARRYAEAALSLLGQAR